MGGAGLRWKVLDHLPHTSPDSGECSALGGPLPDLGATEAGKAFPGALERPPGHQDARAQPTSGQGSLRPAQGPGALPPVGQPPMRREACHWHWGSRTGCVWYVTRLLGQMGPWPHWVSESVTGRRTPLPRIIPCTCSPGLTEEQPAFWNLDVHTQETQRRHLLPSYKLEVAGRVGRAEPWGHVPGVCWRSLSSWAWILTSSSRRSFAGATFDCR